MKTWNSNPFAISGVFKGNRLHLGVTGSIAAYKICDVLRLWLKCGISVSATLTEGGRQFITPLLIKALGAFPVYEDHSDVDEDPFRHLEPGQTGGAFIIAPCSANFLARAAAGSCSDMLSCQVLAFSGPIAAAPAMNPAMWTNCATQSNIETLRKRNWLIIGPASGSVACGEYGTGRLAPASQIYLAALYLLAPKDMRSLNVLVTLGPTREYCDCARFLSNPSTGEMGVALATAAWLRGANVTAITGPGVTSFLPEDIKRISVESATQMFEAAYDYWAAMDYGIFTAAVADFHIKNSDRGVKLKKNSLALNPRLELAANPDILAELAHSRKKNQKVLGFAAESATDPETLEELALLKLKTKNADMIAANIVSGAGSAFANEQSSLVIVDKYGQKAVWPQRPKADSAWELCSWLLQM